MNDDDALEWDAAPTNFRREKQRWWWYAPTFLDIIICGASSSWSCIIRVIIIWSNNFVMPPLVLFVGFYVTLELM